jgi:C1A family cysteine protease
VFNLPHKFISADTNKIIHTGWLPPLPDLRDYTAQHPQISKITQKLGLLKRADNPLPPRVDLRPWFSPIEDQGNLGSCTANAAAGVVEYFENKAFGKYKDASRRFIYKTARNLMGVTGDTGAWLRTVMGAIAFCGVAPEEYWQYTDHDPEFDDEPSAFVYSIAKKYEAIKYFCHDPLTSYTDPSSVLNSIKEYLATGIPSMFGFYGFSSFDKSDVLGGIPYPCIQEKPQWGHAIVAVGYDDTMKIHNVKSNTHTIGALLIRNSWGTSWGDNGYGWLPYEYVLKKIAMDFWSILSMEWIDTDQFGFFV